MGFNFDVPELFGSLLEPSMPFAVPTLPLPLTIDVF